MSQFNAPAQPPLARPGRKWIWMILLYSAQAQSFTLGSLNRIFIQGAQILVEDLNSTNYTYVNQQRLTPGQPHPLNDGDELRFGRVKLAYHSA